MTEKIYYMARGRAITFGFLLTILGGIGIVPSFFISGLSKGFSQINIGTLLVGLIIFFIFFVLLSSGLYLMFVHIPLVKLTSHGVYYSNNISTTFRHGVTLPMIMPYGGKVDNYYISFSDIYSFHPKSYVITTKDVTTRNSLSTKDEKYNKKEIFIDFKHLSWKDQKEIVQHIVSKIS